MRDRIAVKLALNLLPIVISLALTTLLIVAVGSDPRAVLENSIEGVFRSTVTLAAVFNFWIPLALCSVGLVVTFTAGLWNIGVEGQMAMGALFASWAAQYLVLPSPLLIGVEIALAMLGGAAWAALVGVLKLRLGVHEIFGGVALNALASVLTIYLISGPWQPPEGGSAQATAPFPTDALLPPLSPDFPVNALALAIVAASVIGIALALRGTRWGLHLRATGKNPRSALLLGVPTTTSAMSALVVCGAIAGIAGAYRVLFTYASLRPLVTGGIGFLALLVVLLVGARAVWAALTALGFAVILGGSTRLKVALQLDQSLAGVLQGLIVLTVLLVNGFKARLLRDPGSEIAVPPAATIDISPAASSLTPSDSLDQGTSP
ncbi:MAG: ABC transporter permease [Chloroflexota bacterium]|nr:ABC transporter permease [Chloroflexota bacterium]